MRRPLLVPGLLLLAVAATAQTFPSIPRTGSVFDGADLLSASQEQSISQLSRDFKRDTGAPIAVATLTGLDRYEAKAMGIQKYSTALFNQWRVGKQNANGGILLVVAKADRKVWVALGKDWGHAYDAKTTSIVRNTITPLFKQGKFGEGIVKGCKALVHLADAKPAPGASATAGESQTYDPGENLYPDAAFVNEGGSSESFPWGFLLCPAAVVLFLVMAVRSAGRSGRRYSGGYGPGSTFSSHRYDDPRDDSGAFLTGMMVGQAMSQPTYDPTPFDSGPSFDSNSDSGSSFDSGSDSGSFDSGSSDGGGGGGDW